MISNGQMNAGLYIKMAIGNFRFVYLYLQLLIPQWQEVPDTQSLSDKSRRFPCNIYCDLCINKSLLCLNNISYQPLLLQLYYSASLTPLAIEINGAFSFSKRERS